MGKKLVRRSPAPKRTPESAKAWYSTPSKILALTSTAKLQAQRRVRKSAIRQAKIAAWLMRATIIAEQLIRKLIHFLRVARFLAIMRNAVQRWLESQAQQLSVPALAATCPVRETSKLLVAALRLREAA